MCVIPKYRELLLARWIRFRILISTFRLQMLLCSNQTYSFIFINGKVFRTWWPTHLTVHHSYLVMPKWRNENKYQPADYNVSFFLFCLFKSFLKTIKQNYNCLTTFGTSSTTITTRHDVEELWFLYAYVREHIKNRPNGLVKTTIRRKQHHK